MRYSLVAGAILAGVSRIAADCFEEKGNWYCDQVQASTWTNFGAAGQFNKITTMDNGVCSSTSQTYGGGMSPLDEVSWHFRGPLHLKQFAFYQPGSSSVKRDVKRSAHARRHAHHDIHRHHESLHHHLEKIAREEKRDVGDVVTATINGQVVTWINSYAGATSSESIPAASSAAAEASSSSPSRANKHPHSKSSTDSTGDSSSDSSPDSSSQTSSDSSSQTSPDSSQSSTDSSSPDYGDISVGDPVEVGSVGDPVSIAAPVNAGAGSWGRQAYYNAETGQADGLVFLNHRGGTGSGVFDYTWGNSLSYASSDCSTGSATPTTLADTLINDDQELVIMSNNPCQGDDCGGYRPGTVAYHGFTGQSKVFLIEYSMPLSGKTGFNADMPAAWMLNAAIPRTLQYGQSDCSCWISGCGEWDIFEVLDSGNTKTKATWHGQNSIGDSNWFQRPTDATQKAAIVFDGTTSTGYIVLLPSDTSFDSTLADSIVTGFTNNLPNQNSKVTLP